MDRPKRTSVRRPADYSIAWWNTVGLDGLLPLKESEGISTKQESQRDRKDSATSSSEEEISECTSYISSETDVEVNLNLSESESEICDSLPESGIKLEDREGTAGKKSKSYSAHKGRYESEGGTIPRKRRRKTVQTPRKGSMKRSDGVETKGRRSEREGATIVGSSQKIVTETSFVAASK
jgi:hypothetical protein